MRGWTFHPALHSAWRGSGPSGLSRFFGLSGLFGFAQQETQDKPDKLENLALPPLPRSSPPRYWDRERIYGRVSRENLTRAFRDRSEERRVGKECRL